MCVVLNVGGGKSKGRTKTHTRWKFEAEVTAVVVWSGVGDVGGL